MYSQEAQRQLTELSHQLLDQNIPNDLDQAIEHADQMHQVINYHEWRYYIINDPVISDFEFDQLYKHLEDLENKYPQLITSASPTQRVSTDLSSDFPAVAHLKPMLSLANSYDAEDLVEFDEQIRKLTGLTETEIEYCVEPKYDGGSIALVYENDQLVRAATRGNGILGEEMTANARAIRSIPLHAKFSSKGIRKVELRGEVLIRKDIFKKLNEARKAQALPLFANPRNTASGGLRMKDPKEVAQRGLVAFIYQLGYAVNEGDADLLATLKTHDESIKLLDLLGFKVPRTERKVCKGIREVIDFCIKWETQREAFPFEIDGMVIKVNQLELQEKSGYTSHHPRWAIAYKFKAKQATSKLLHVDYQVGKIGSITPVAKIAPVPIAGVTVSSVSLHNEDFIRTKDIRIGDTVLVERAGDVIPYIVKPMEELRDGSEQIIEFPTHCPSCSNPLVRPEHEAAWRCVNPDCEAQVLQRMIHHVSKDAMDIDGFGRSYVERFYELGWLKSIADIYRLDYDKIEALEGFGRKSSDKLKQSVELAMQNPIHRLLYSLAIHHLGKKVSKLLAATVNHVMDLKNWTIEDYTHIKDIGPVVAENVIAFFQNEHNIELLRDMEALGVNMEQTADDQARAVAADAPLSGKSILFTGTLNRLSRKEAQEKAELAGARNVSAVSNKLDVLVVGEKAGSKLKKARELGSVTILTEDEFIELINNKQLS